MKSQDIKAISTSIIALGVVIGGVIFFVGQNEKPKEKVPIKNPDDIERMCMRVSSNWFKESIHYQPYEECMEANGLVP